MPRNPVIFTIEIPIRAKTVLEAVENSTYALDDFETEDFKQAGLPDIDTLRKQIANDPGFIRQLKKQMTELAGDQINDSVAGYDDALYVADVPAVKNPIAKLDKICEARAKRQQAQKDAARVKEAIDFLTARGYSVG